MYAGQCELPGGVEIKSIGLVLPKLQPLAASTGGSDASSWCVAGTAWMLTRVALLDRARRVLAFGSVKHQLIRCQLEALRDQSRAILLLHSRPAVGTKSNMHAKLSSNSAAVSLKLQSRHLEPHNRQVILLGGHLVLHKAWQVAGCTCSPTHHSPTLRQHSRAITCL